MYLYTNQINLFLEMTYNVFSGTLNHTQSVSSRSQAVTYCETGNVKETGQDRDAVTKR